MIRVSKAVGTLLYQIAKGQARNSVFNDNYQQFIKLYVHSLVLITCAAFVIPASLLESLCLFHDYYTSCLP